MTELEQQRVALNAEYRRALATRAPNHRELAQELQALEHRIRCERAGAGATPLPTVNPAAADHPDRRSRESSRLVPTERTRLLTVNEVRDIRREYQRVKNTKSEREFAAHVVVVYNVSLETALNILRGVTYRNTPNLPKITEEQTGEIIRRYDAAVAAGTARGLCAQMAREYAISKTRVSEIVNGHGKQEKEVRNKRDD